MPAIGGKQPITVQFRDYSGEVKSVRVYSGELTAITLPGFLTQLSALEAALDAVTLGVRSSTQWGELNITSNSRPVDKTAQVETEMLVRVQGATTEAPWSFRIPTVDYAAFNYLDDAVILSGPGASAATVALVAAIEALCKMPNDETEAVTVVGMNVVS